MYVVGCFSNRFFLFGTNWNLRSCVRKGDHMKFSYLFVTAIAAITSSSAFAMIYADGGGGAPEPVTMALLAAGGVVGGVNIWLKNRRKK